MVKSKKDIIAKLEELKVIKAALLDSKNPASTDAVDVSINTLTWVLNNDA
jgi:hypothetical protein